MLTNVILEPNTTIPDEYAKYGRINDLLDKYVAFILANSYLTIFDRTYPSDNETGKYWLKHPNCDHLLYMRTGQTQAGSKYPKVIYGQILKMDNQTSIFSNAIYLKMNSNYSGTSQANIFITNRPGIFHVFDFARKTSWDDKIGFLRLSNGDWAAFKVTQSQLNIYLNDSDVEYEILKGQSPYSVLTEDGKESVIPARIYNPVTNRLLAVRPDNNLYLAQNIGGYAIGDVLQSGEKYYLRMTYNTPTFMLAG